MRWSPVQQAISSAQPNEVTVKIALVYNGITRDMLLQGPLDRTAECDGPSTVAALCEVIRKFGNEIPATSGHAPSSNPNGRVLSDVQRARIV